MARSEEESARESARSEKLRRAGVVAERFGQVRDPVFEAFVSNKRSVLRLAGLLNETAIIAEIKSREEKDRLGAPLPAPYVTD